MDQTGMDLICIAADLRQLLSRLDRAGIAAAGALVDHALSLIHTRIVEVEQLRPRTDPVLSDFRLMDEMIDSLFTRETPVRPAH